MLTGRKPGSKEHGNIAASGETDQVGAAGHMLRGIDGNDSAPDLRLHSFPALSDSRGELMNFLGMVERDDWQVESWTVQAHDARACQ